MKHTTLRKQIAWFSWVAHLEFMLLGAVLLVGAGFGFYYGLPFAQTSNEIASQGLNLTGSVTSLVGNSTTRKQGTLFGLLDRYTALTTPAGDMMTSAKGTLDAGTKLLGSLSDLSVSIKATTDDVPNTQTKLDTALDNFGKLPEWMRDAVNNATGNLPKLELSLAQTSDATRDYIAGPLSAATYWGASAAADYGQLAKDGHEMIHPPKYDGAHPFLHKTGTVALFPVKHLLLPATEGALRQGVIYR